MRGLIHLDPRGASATVSVDAEAFTAEFDGDVVSFPLAVSTLTDVWVDEGNYTVTWSLNDIEVATSPVGIGRGLSLRADATLPNLSPDDVQALVDAGGSGTSGSVPAVDGTVTDPGPDMDSGNPLTGYKFFTTADTAVVVAVGLDGDDFPRLVITTDGLFAFFDGTADPFQSGSLFSQTRLFGAGGLAVASDAEVRLESVSGVVSIPNLPTADPMVADQLWNDGGVLTVSAGP